LKIMITKLTKKERFDKNRENAFRIDLK
jgi:hypothetical protein